MSKHKQPINHFLHSNTEISKEIVQHLDELKQINKQFHAFIDEKMRPHCRVANASGNTLTIEVDSSVWATALRYRIPDLLANLRFENNLSHLTQIDFYVKPEAVDKKANQKVRKLQMSGNVSNTLHMIAEGIGDKKLSKILHQIAQHGDKPD